MVKIISSIIAVIFPSTRRIFLIMARKKPLRLYTIDNARRRLEQRAHWSKWLREPVERETIIQRSVEKNIFRTFAHMDEPPSDCYRAWATRIYPRLLRRLEKVRSQRTYDRVIQAYALQLALHWQQVQGEKMEYGPATKIINLLVKMMFLYQDLHLPSLPTWYNVPFDSYTLQPLKEIINDLLSEAPFGMPMNGQMTMNYVVCAEQYDQIQGAIRELCGGTRKTPLDFELWAWNSRH